MQNTYPGPERRIKINNPPDNCEYSATIAALKDSVDELYGVLSIGRTEFDKCKVKVDADISTLHADMASLRSDVSTMRADMHSLTLAVGDMRGSLAEIAGSLKSLADFPDTWAKLKGWWAVMRWLKDNWFLLAIIFSSFAWMIWLTVQGLAI